MPIHLLSPPSASCSTPTGPTPGARLQPSRRRHRVVAAAAALACIGATSKAGADMTDAGLISSAEVLTPDGHGFGRFEARVMMPAGDGVVGSFFLWKDGSEQAGAYWNEIDFEKIDKNCELQLNAPYGQPEVQHQTVLTNYTDLCTAYHTYAIEWTPDHIAWSIDGKEVRRDTGATAQSFADNALTLGLQYHFNIWPGNSNFGGNFSASILPVQEYISWVQYSAYTPGAGDVDCNFTLAWRESFEQGIPDTWSEGNWMSPYNLSTDTGDNVTASNGVAVLSLTADGTTGFTGTPPPDDGDLPSVQTDAGADGMMTVPDAAPVACDAGSSSQGDAGGQGASSGSTSGSGSTSSGQGQSTGGCSVVSLDATGGVGPALAALLGIASVLRRRRAQRRDG